VAHRESHPFKGRHTDSPLVLPVLPSGKLMAERKIKYDSRRVTRKRFPEVPNFTIHGGRRPEGSHSEWGVQEGQSLRQEEIANLFGVSRVPVREALRQLEGEGLVISHGHRGAVVSTLSR